MPACIGCRNDLPEGLPALYPCNIAVQQDGEPLGGATVMLIPDMEATGVSWIPMGKTDESGIAALATNARYPGAPVGRYKVVVSKRVAVDNIKLSPPPPEDSPDYDRWAKQSLLLEPDVFDLVEPKYGSVEDTPLAIEVDKKLNETTVDAGRPVRIKRKKTPL